MKLPPGSGDREEGRRRLSSWWQDSGPRGQNPSEVACLLALRTPADGTPHLCILSWINLSLDLSRPPNLTLLQASSRLSSNASSSRKSSRLLLLSLVLLPVASFSSPVSFSISLFPYLSCSLSSLLPQALTSQTKLCTQSPWSSLVWLSAFALKSWV